MKYSGIDLHANNSVVTVTDDSDRVLYERRLPNELSVILAALAPHQTELAGVVVESTFNWYWLVDGLQAAGYPVELANPAKMKRYEGLKYSNDESDARYLAHLLRLGILPTGYIYPREERAVRDLARKRMQLVRTRTMHLLAVQSALARHTGGRIAGDAVKQLRDEALAGLGLLPDVVLALQANLAVMRTLDEQIGKLERQLRERARPRAEYSLLKSAPGIGETLAIVILLETGRIDRFAQVGQFASYARCVGSRRLSNGKKKGEGNRKNGNKYLAWAFVEAANYARRYNAAARRFYDRKAAACNPMVATKALAHKLARACYHIMKEGQPFDEKRCFA